MTPPEHGAGVGVVRAELRCPQGDSDASTIAGSLDA